jgi:hypothetical protein
MSNRTPVSAHANKHKKHSLVVGIRSLKKLVIVTGCVGIAPPVPDYDDISEIVITTQVFQGYVFLPTHMRKVSENIEHL